MTIKITLAVMILSFMSAVVGDEVIVRHEKSSNQIAYAAKFSHDLFLLYEKTIDHSYTSDIELYLEKGGTVIPVPNVFKRKTISNVGFLNLESNDSSFYYIHENKLYLASLDNNKIKTFSVRISDNPNEFIKKIIRTDNGLVLLPDSVRDAKVFVYDIETQTKNSIYFKEHVGRSIQDVKFMDNQVIVVSSHEKELLLVLYEKNTDKTFNESMRQEIKLSGYIQSVDIIKENAKDKVVTISTLIFKKGLLNFMNSEELIVTDVNLNSGNTKNNKILSQKIVGDSDVSKQFIKCGKKYITYNYDKESITENYDGKKSAVTGQLDIFPREIFIVSSRKNQKKYLIVNFMKSLGKYFNKGFFVQKININCGDNN